MNLNLKQQNFQPTLQNNQQQLNTHIQLPLQLYDHIRPQPKQQLSCLIQQQNRCRPIIPPNLQILHICQALRIQMKLDLKQQNVQPILQNNQQQLNKHGQLLLQLN
jgi:hypothetical protein